MQIENYHQITCGEMDSLTNISVDRVISVGLLELIFVMIIFY